MGKLRRIGMSWYQASLWDQRVWMDPAAGGCPCLLRGCFLCIWRVPVLHPFRWDFYWCWWSPLMYVSCIRAESFISVQGPLISLSLGQKLHLWFSIWYLFSSLYTPILLLFFSTPTHLFFSSLHSSLEDHASKIISTVWGHFSSFSHSSLEFTPHS